MLNGYYLDYIGLKKKNPMEVHRIPKFHVVWLFLDAAYTESIICAGVLPENITTFVVEVSVPEFPGLFFG